MVMDIEISIRTLRLRHVPAARSWSWPLCSWLHQTHPSTFQKCPWSGSPLVVAVRNAMMSLRKQVRIFPLSGYGFWIFYILKTILVLFWTIQHGTPLLTTTYCLCTGLTGIFYLTAFRKTPLPGCIMVNTFEIYNTFGHHKWTVLVCTVILSPQAILLDLCSN